MLLEQPTRGLDIESVIYLWTKLKERCNQGGAVMFTSSDLDELLRYSDRILVFFTGQISGPLEATSHSGPARGSDRRDGLRQTEFGEGRMTTDRWINLGFQVGALILSLLLTTVILVTAGALPSPHTRAY